MGVDNYTALKQVSLMINEPSLTQLGSWRLTAVLNVPVETWIGNAAAVLSGAWGAVTRRAQQSGYSRTAVYTHAQRVVQAVVSLALAEMCGRPPASAPVCPVQASCMVTASTAGAGGKWTIIFLTLQSDYDTIHSFIRGGRSRVKAWKPRACHNRLPAGKG